MSAHLRCLSFFVLGEPKAQPRAKAARIGGFVRMYTPASAKDWKASIRREAFLALEKQEDRSQLCGPLSVRLVFHFPRPKAHFNSKGIIKPGAPHWHVTKPDRDNCEKAVLDALGDLGLFKNDSQVCAGEVVKVYADARAGCSITIQELADATLDQTEGKA